MQPPACRAGPAILDITRSKGIGPRAPQRHGQAIKQGQDIRQPIAKIHEPLLVLPRQPHSLRLVAGQTMHTQAQANTPSLRPAATPHTHTHTRAARAFTHYCCCSTLEACTSTTSHVRPWSQCTGPASVQAAQPRGSLSLLQAAPMDPVPWLASCAKPRQLRRLRQQALGQGSIAPCDHTQHTGQAQGKAQPSTAAAVGACACRQQPHMQLQ